MTYLVNIDITDYSSNQISGLTEFCSNTFQLHIDYDCYIINIPDKIFLLLDLKMKKIGLNLN